MGLLDLFKNYVIDSEEDIPVEYREEIEQKLSTEPKEIQFEATQLTPGINGTILSEYNEIKEAFSDNSLYYLGHGTPGNETILESILQNGLITFRKVGTVRSLNSTAINLGSGHNQLFEEIKGELDDWGHKDSKNIVIVSVPKDYFFRFMEIDSLADPYKPFYIGSKERGFNLRPEFIKGIYNAETHSFTENANFYQRLDEETQKKLFEDVKMAYIKYYAEVSNVNPRETSELLPLNEQEMEKISIEWYKEQLKKLREDRTFNEQDLEKELYDIANEMTKTDFEDATRLVKDSARDSEKDELFMNNDGWEVSDDWD